MHRKLPLAVHLLMFVTVVMGTNEFMVMGVLPDLAEGLQVEYTAIGALVSMYALSYAFSTPLISGFIGRFDRYRVLMSLMLLFLLMNTWSMLASGYLSMALSRLFTAAVAGVLFSISLTFVSELVSPQLGGPAVAWMYIGFNVASVMGVPLGTFVSGCFGWRYAFLLISVLTVLVMLLCYLYLPRKAERNDPVSRRGGSAELLKDPRSVLGFLATVFIYGGIYTVFTYVTPILEDGIGFTESTVGIGLMLFGFSCMASNYLAGKVAVHGGLRTGCIAYVLMLLLFLAFPSALSVPSAGFITLLVLGVVMYLVNTSMQVLVMDVARNDYPDSIALATSLNPSAFSIGVVLGAIFGGMVFDNFGLVDLGYLSAVFTVIGLFFTIVLVMYCRRPGMGTSVA